ncbi:MAG: hypothetical protein GX993_03295 [Bacteroidales bacterium]|nr:hypothetical protein [Bacteroidales bacterium]
MVIAIILTVISNDKKKKEREEAMSQAIETIPDFTPTMKITGVDNRFTFATDNEHQRIIYIVGLHKQIFNYEDIISVELIEDNNVMLKKSTGRTIGGAILGGAVAGSVGAVVGGLSGSSKQQNLHSSVKVKILLRNNPVPSLEIACYDYRTMGVETKPVSDDHPLYRQGKNDAIRITDTLSVIIDAVDRAHNTKNKKISPISGSIADEIAKLAELKDKGILTENEFAAQKAKILNQDSSTKPNTPLKLDLPTSNSFDDEWREILRAEGKLEACKRYKEAMGVSLAMAKEYIDSIE